MTSKKKFLKLEQPHWKINPRMFVINFFESKVMLNWDWHFKISSQDHVCTMFLRNVQFQESKYFSQKWHWSYTTSYILSVKCFVNSFVRRWEINSLFSLVDKGCIEKEWNRMIHSTDATFPIKVLKIITMLRSSKDEKQSNVCILILLYRPWYRMHCRYWQKMYHDKTCRNWRNWRMEECSKKMK